jgi:heterotetrameric sarcosine oxidase gamma subunit
MTVLPTFCDLPITSPLTGVFPDQITVSALGIGEISDRALFHMRGNTAEAAFHVSDMSIGDVAARHDGLLARLRRDEFLLMTHTPRDTFALLERMIGSQRVTLTDVTHGRCILLLLGKDALQVLPKICALDFSDQQFPNLHAAQTSLAKVRALIIRADVNQTPAYALIIDRSLALYVWKVVFDAMREFGGVALSHDSLNNLREGSLW